MANILRRKYIDLIGRIWFSAIFINAIPKKITNFTSVVDSIASQGVPELISYPLLIAAILCLIFGSLNIILGKNQKLGSTLLLIFLIPTTIIFHLFPIQPSALIRNISLIGALLIILTRESFGRPSILRTNRYYW